MSLGNASIDASLVEDITSGSGSTTFISGTATALGTSNSIVFAAIDSSHGLELWYLGYSFQES